MSILQPFKRLVDPIRARIEEAEFKAKRELPVQEDAGEPPVFRCRVCSRESTDRTFCPECLADTMEPVAEEAMPPQ